MQEIISSAVLDGLGALKAASKGVPNNLLRDLNAIHANTAYGDLPSDLQAAIAASVRAAFTRLLKEGYSVSHADAPPPRPAAPRHPSGERRPPRPGGPSGPGRPGGANRPGGGNRPGGAGRPGGSDRPGGAGRKPPRPKS
ncbi:MAG: hypothetical protein AVDCRST_MAG91-2015 [uncultured Sphingomonadaceae bacterium]|uniref:Uncharacterized protein n=1 Tax=uncultured Sphingomonadaceae bacterium TaxID=169976 RepID=A0A6J4TBB4_9SPHN|nr:MAG: hypothetical protein AVDCRST_MAG91-2015 [uncultured Sphingomonadaceae bacterium]